MAAKHHGLRQSIIKAGGFFLTTTAALTVAVGVEKIESARSLVGVGTAALAAATASLFDIYKQSAEEKKSRAENPYFILWELGLLQPSEVRKVREVDLVKPPQLPLGQFEVHAAHHWLCPPTNGLGYLLVKK